MPLSFDFPLETLRRYTGINPCPSDIEAYYKRALEELEQIDPAVTLQKAAQQPPVGSGRDPVFAEYYDLWFTGLSGARIYAKLVKPAGAAAERRMGPKGTAPALLQFHGYSMDSGDWQSKLSWAAAGFTVAALDCRGQGGKSEDTGSVGGNTLQGHIIRGLEDAINGNPDKFLYRSIYMDTVRLARIVMDLDWVDEKRVGATGWSQGGGLTLACAALEPRIARAAPVYPFLSDYKRVWEMDKAVDAYTELALWFRRFDPTHKREDSVFESLGYIDVHNMTPWIKASVLMATGLMDTICPPSTQFAAFNRIQSEKNHVLYPDFSHEDLPGLHDTILDFMLEL